MGRVRGDQKLYEVLNHTENVRYLYLLKEDVDHFMKTKWKGHKVELVRRPHIKRDDRSI